MIVKAKNLYKHIGEIIVLEPPPILQNEQPDIKPIKVSILEVRDDLVLLKRIDNNIEFSVTITDKEAKFKLYE